jgi:hypothetical protein
MLGWPEAWFGPGFNDCYTTNDSMWYSFSIYASGGKPGLELGLDGDGNTIGLGVGDGSHDYFSQSSSQSSPCTGRGTAHWSGTLVSPWTHP